MRKLIYSIGVSLDGYIADAPGKFDWAVPDEEQHRFHNKQEAELSAHLCGRRMYETLKVWDEVDERSAPGEPVPEFARLWRATQKFVFSTTLDEVGPNATLVKGDAVDQVTRLKEEAGGPLAVGGAGLASTLAESGPRRRVRAVREPGPRRRRNALLPAARGQARARAARDAHVRLARRLPPLRARVGCGRLRTAATCA